MNTIFQPISPLWEAFPTSKPQTTEAAASGGSIFADILKSTVNNVRETEDEVAKNEYLLATGQLDNPAMAMIAGTKNAIAVDFLIQLRNKAQDAYSELTRMNF